MILSLIKEFVSLNRQLSRRLERKFESFFATPSYEMDLVKIITDSLKNNSIKKILEIGGINRPILQKNKGYTYYNGNQYDRAS